MSTHKSIDKICIAILAVTLAAALIFCNGKVFGIQSASRVIGYETRLFDNSSVHTVDIVMDDWDSFIETCENEEYSACSVVIDGEAYKNVGIRAKGNTSLRNVSQMGSSRYSFKIEFDHYDSSKSYHGLDKLCLNNIIQDNTFMKDYLSYTLMDGFGADSPLCSYAYITVNGEDWGLYLAVEGAEEAFLQRNYGSDYGELYKPDSMSFGGGRGNGKNFDMDNIMNKDSGGSDSTDTQSFSPPDAADGEAMPPDIPDGFDPSKAFGNNGESDENGENQSRGFGNAGNMGGMNSSDVMLQYTNDDPDSYPNIFDNAKTDVSEADKDRLISSLKSLSEGNDIESTVNVDEVIRYFVVHNFLCNGDSYTGSIVHNYYLYEKDGKLSMIPWDYNLAFGTFQGTGATTMVNSPIDTPVSGDMSARPMVSWIFENEDYTGLYHQLFDEFISGTDFAAIIDSTAEMIAEYVEKDPTKFCTYEEFLKGTAAIREFCLLRTESIRGQLDGTIPSDSDGQSADNSSLVDASSLSLSDMGTMGGEGFGGNGNNGRRPDMNSDNSEMQPPSSSENQNRETFGSGVPEFPDAPESQENQESSDGAAPNEAYPPDTRIGGSGLDSTETVGGSTDRRRGGSFQTMDPMGGAAEQERSNSLLSLCVSVTVLAAGLVFAFKFKR